MPTANRRRFVPAAIRMFLAQDYEDKELLIVDDGSDTVSDLVIARSRSTSNAVFASCFVSHSCPRSGTPTIFLAPLDPGSKAPKTRVISSRPGSGPTRLRPATQLRLVWGESCWCRLRRLRLCVILNVAASAPVSGAKSGHYCNRKRRTS